MKKRVIMFPYNDSTSVESKVKFLTDIVGENNISTEGLSYNIPQVLVRCNEKKWKDIMFKIDLEKAYYQELKGSATIFIAGSFSFYIRYEGGKKMLSDGRCKETKMRTDTFKFYDVENLIHIVPETFVQYSHQKSTATHHKIMVTDYVKIIQEFPKFFLVDFGNYTGTIHKIDILTGDVHVTIMKHQR